jgi:hypothetical protein
MMVAIRAQALRVARHEQHQPTPIGDFGKA